jgi:hypothetical protein
MPIFLLSHRLLKFGPFNILALIAPSDALAYAGLRLAADFWGAVPRMSQKIAVPARPSRFGRVPCRDLGRGPPKTLPLYRSRGRPAG